MGKLVSSVVGAVTGAGDTSKAGAEAAAAQERAAFKGAYAGSFRPVNMTTTFGSSQFGIETDPVTGLPRVTSAGYTLAPELQQIQQRLAGLYPGALQSAEAAAAYAPQIQAGGLKMFDLAQQYLGETPEQTRQNYIREQQALLDPLRAREEERLGAGVFSRGRAGLNIGDIGQPELFSLASARRAQDLQLAAQAEQAAQQRQAFAGQQMAAGLGVLGTGFNVPVQALSGLGGYLGTVSDVEALGRQPYDLAVQLGQIQSAAGAQQGQTLSSGLQQAAATRFQAVQQANQANAQFLSGLIGAGAQLYGGSQGWFKS